MPHSTRCVLLSFVGRRAGGFFLLLSATSAGMFVSAPALLPSSSSMTLFMLVMAMWLKGRFSLAVREVRQNTRCICVNSGRISLLSRKGSQKLGEGCLL